MFTSVTDLPSSLRPGAARPRPSPEAAYSSQGNTVGHQAEFWWVELAGFERSPSKRCLRLFIAP